MKKLTVKKQVELFAQDCKLINLQYEYSGLPKITLIHRKQMEKYMNHLHKVPNTGKYVQKKFVRIGEGSITYSIGHHRFIEMARAAGAVYKINEGTGGTVLVNLEIFDEYMEQFREEPREMKNPLWKPENDNWKRK